MKRISLLVFCAGVIIAALSASPTPPKWIPFIFGLAVTVAGGLMARFRAGGNPAGKKDAAAAELSAAELAEKLKGIGGDLKALSARSANDFAGQAGKFQAEIESLHTRLQHLIDGRQSIQNEHGMEAFARIFSQIAAVERSLNRAWSALIDGYPKEVKASLERAADMTPEAESSARQCVSSV